MHPELLSALAAERRRDLNGAMAGRRPARARTARRGRDLVRPVILPRFRVSWTHASLAAEPAGRRGGSVVIVISATRVG
jgi:hypothetical protein